MNRTKILLVMAVCVTVLSYTTRLTFGDEVSPDTADCAITITVDTIIEWEGADEADHFPNISLDSQSDEAPITKRADAPEGSSDYTLWTNCNVVLTADTSTTAQLTDTDGAATDVLITKYKISTDGDGDATAGITKTGATDSDISSSGASTWTLYSSFLSPTGLAITHAAGDGGVEVTLEVQATNEADEVADAGAYTATQTITATWDSDD